MTSPSQRCRYSKSLPLRVKVCKGFYGVSDQTAVTTGDMFNLHFVKNTKVCVHSVCVCVCVCEHVQQAVYFHCGL